MRLLDDSDFHLMPSLRLSTTVYLSAEPNFTQLPQYVMLSTLVAVYSLLLASLSQVFCWCLFFDWMKACKHIW